MKTLEERFFSKVRKTPGHWEWLATTRLGYGRIGTRVVGKSRMVLAEAHRVSWLIHRGPIPTGLNVLHKCDTPGCVKPSHLFLGTQKDNVQDMLRKGRRWHGEVVPWAKLSVDQVKSIRQLATQGVTHRELGTQFGVRCGVICNIIHRKTWKHV